MNRRIVQSSNIRAVGHDPRSNTLEVEFHDGGIYQYAGVPANEYAALVSSQSVGSHFHKHIKDNYKSTRVDKTQHL
jgi:hypothetical protein